MKKFFMKISIILFCLTMTLNINSNYVFAKTSLDEIHRIATNFIDIGEKQSNNINDTEISETVVPIAQILVLTGSIVIAICTAVIAIKYLMASPDEKAKLKVQLVGLVVATIVIFGAQFIWSTLYEFLSDI